MNILVNTMAEAFKITTESLTDIKDKIEKMPKNNQIEILRILKQNPSTKLNENKSGIFVNISFLPKETIDDIVKYMKYYGDQELAINQIEQQKQEFKNTFFTNDQQVLS